MVDYCKIAIVTICTLGFIVEVSFLLIGHYYYDFDNSELMFGEMSMTELRLYTDYVWLKQIFIGLPNAVLSILTSPYLPQLFYGSQHSEEK